MGGEWWLAGNVAFYGLDRASVYAGGTHPDSLDLDPVYSPWTSDADLRRRGGVLLWDMATHGTGVPPHLARRFPAHERHSVILRRQTRTPLPPLAVGVLVVPPADVAPAT